MLLRIEPSNGIAIYEQIVNQVSFAVAGQALKAGDLVPSVRQLARTLAVNPNTVARAYGQLRRDGILQSVRGTGLTVTSEAAKVCRAARSDFVRKRIRQVLQEAHHSGLPRDEILKLVERELDPITNE